MKLWHKISNRFRRRRPDEPLVRPTAPLTAPAKRRSVKALNVLGWAAAAAVVVTVAWALPYIVAVATLGELCPWTPPGISDPSWSCGASTSAKSSLAPVPHPAFRALGTLAFAAPSGPRRKADVFAVNADGTDLTNLTRSDDADDRNPA